MPAAELRGIEHDIAERDELPELLSRNALQPEDSLGVISQRSRKASLQALGP